MPTTDKLKTGKPGKPASPDPSAIDAEALAALQGGDLRRADQLYRDILAVRPRDLLALNNAALVAKRLGQPQLALTRLSKAVRYHPGMAQAHFNLGNTLADMLRLDDAIAAFQRAIELKPDYVKAHLNLGIAFDKQHRFADAAAAYHRALTFGGDHAETHSNLGNCYKAQNKFREALTHFICAATLEPQRAEFIYDVGMARFEVRDYPEAATALERVLEIDAGHAGAASLLLYIHQIACNWPAAARLRPLVRAATDAALAEGGRCAEGPLESLSRDADPGRNALVARHFALQFATPGIALPPRRAASPARQRLRVGYLSADFRDHAVAHVMAGVIEHHDRSRVEVFAYGYGVKDSSAWRQRIEAGSDRFVDLAAIDDHRAIELIRQDDIDVLVDLTLWTRGGRPRICAARPARVQVQYLGFPGSSGAAQYDYAIVDRVVVPPEHRPFWCEALAFMPDCYFVPDASQPIASDGLSRLNVGLPADAIVFCSLNQGYKIDEAVFDAWIEILKAVPNAVLWLADGSQVMVDNLRQEAARRELDPQRLVFAGRIHDKAAHLQRVGLADIALDTLAYNGHTTTSDTLWAGVPVITTEGRHFASRVSASMLRACRMPELVARDVPEYVALAIELGRSEARRREVRAQLSDARRSAPLFDGVRAVRGLEALLMKMQQRQRAGEPPADLEA